MRSYLLTIILTCLQSGSDMEGHTVYHSTKLHLFWYP